MWNGHRYFETRIDRGSLILPNYRSSLRSNTTQAAPNFRRRLEAEVPVHAGLRSNNLSIIKEDGTVPVAARTMLLIGMFPLRITKETCSDSQVTNYSHLLGQPLSGKTTIFNHLQILYGNGITELERLTAFEFIVRKLIDMFVDALLVWSDSYDQDYIKNDIKVCNSVTYYVLC